MGDDRGDMMDLDLNLAPSFLPSSDSRSELGSPSSDSRNIDDRLLVLDHIRRLEAVTLRARQRRRWRQSRIPSEMRNISMELIINPSNDGGLQTGEGSLTADERNTENGKTCKGNGHDLIAKALGKGEAEDKESSDGSSFFDCNICLDVAKDPVVTCCGHLFCWPCLYQWLHVHSDAKECPVCKGEVTDLNITPIYGRGNTTSEPEKEEEIGLKIPPRPQGRRIAGIRQSIHGAASALQMEEMIRRIGSRFNVRREWALPQDLDVVREMLDRPRGRNPLLEQSLAQAQQEVGDLVQGSGNFPVAGHRLLRSQTQRTASLSSLSSALVQAYVLGHPSRRNQTRSPSVEDRDSVSSIAAVIHSGSQIVDTAMEIDSSVSLSSSSSRRRTDVSRISDVDSGVSRATRRRRLH